MSARAVGIVYEFGGFTLDARRRLLLSSPGGHAIPLPTTSVDTLLYLVEHAGELVEKASLLQATWPGVSVAENSLAQSVSALRHALGDHRSDPRFIVTVPGRGYRFIAKIAIHAARRGEPSLAVLPFKPLGDADVDDALPLGMTDAMIRRIGSLRQIDVRPLSSVCRYGSLEQDAIDAGRELGVEIVVDGSVQRSGDRLRMSVRLIDVASGRQLWGDRFDEDFTDIFAIQDTIAERAASALLNELTIADRHRLRHHPTEDVYAYQAYVTGWLALTRPGSDSLNVALRSLQEAVTRDPAFALAHACLAHCHTLLCVFGIQAPHDVYPKAHAAVLRALELDPELAEAHVQLAQIRATYYLDWDGNERALQRALEINPRSSMPHHYTGLRLLVKGQIDDALASVRRAQEIEPLAAIFSANIGMIYYYGRRYEEAMRQLEATLAMDAGFDHARSYLGRVYLRMGDAQKAIKAFERRTSITIGSVADLPAAHALAGRRDEAVAELERLLTTAREHYVSAYDVATIYAALGDTQTALDWLERALERRDPPIPLIGVDPAFDLLHADPRFVQVVARVHKGYDRTTAVSTKPA
jgi:TolB-like protein